MACLSSGLCTSQTGRQALLHGQPPPSNLAGATSQRAATADRQQFHRQSNCPAAKRFCGFPRLTPTHPTNTPDPGQQLVRLQHTQPLHLPMQCPAGTPYPPHPACGAHTHLERRRQCSLVGEHLVQGLAELLGKLGPSLVCSHSAPQQGLSENVAGPKGPGVTHPQQKTCIFTGRHQYVFAPARQEQSCGARIVCQHLWRQTHERRQAAPVGTSTVTGRDTLVRDLQQPQAGRVQAWVVVGMGMGGECPSFTMLPACASMGPGQVAKNSTCRRCMAAWPPASTHPARPAASTALTKLPAPGRRRISASRSQVC